ncbi:MAG: alkaline phosphatase D family protein, partial [Planctomycetota bacterium]
MSSLSRRSALKLLAASTALPAASTAEAQSKPVELKPVEHWSTTHDRVFLGGEFWANPMEDWRIVDGAAECQTTGGNRNIHLITHQLTNEKGQFAMSVRVGQVEVRRIDGGAGFLIGIRSELDEYRSNLFAKGGIRAGIVEGSLVLARRSKKLPA